MKVLSLAFTLKAISVLGLMLGLPRPLSAQDSERQLYFVEAGIGLSSVEFSDGRFGVNLATSANYIFGESIISVSFLKSDEFAIFVEPNEYVQSLNFLYGRVHSLYEDKFLFMYQSGISSVRYKARTVKIYDGLLSAEYDSDIRSAIGIPLEISFQTNIFKYAGLSTRLFAVFNSVMPVYGFKTSICVGLLR